LARRLSERLGVEHVELDALYHGPGWTEPDPEDFRQRVSVALADAGDGWVCCGNYSMAVPSVVWPIADTVVVLDLPRATVMRRVVARTLRRVLTREELWNGNREPFRNLYAWDPERNITRWAWVRHDLYHERYRHAAADPAWAHLDFVFLSSPRQVDEFGATFGLS
jgi:adenylate kinase family enzyme